jgi:hypothetical protein
VWPMMLHSCYDGWVFTCFHSIWRLCMILCWPHCACWNVTVQDTTIRSTKDHDALPMWTCAGCGLDCWGKCVCQRSQRGSKRECPQWHAQQHLLRMGKWSVTLRWV